MRKKYILKMMVSVMAISMLLTGCGGNATEQAAVVAQSGENEQQETLISNGETEQAMMLPSIL